MLLKDKSLLSTSLAGQGNGGGIFLNTKDTFTINNSFVGTGVAEGGIGDSGSIKINAGSISANEGSFSSVTHGKGNAGEIIIRAKNSISLADGFSVSGSVFPGGSGNAGNIDISSDSFSITSGAMLSSGVFSANQTLPPGKGNSGNINVSTTGNINISGLHSQITNNLDEGAQGKTGDITISGGSFSLNDNARISTSTFGKGNAGNIKLKIKDNVTVSGSLGIFSEVGKSGMGNAGNIDIEANALFLNNDSSILARVLGKGDAGNINLKIIKDINIIGSGNIGDSSRVASDVALGAEGRGGEISINTDSIYLRDNAFISTLNAGNGNGGNVFLTAKNNVHLMNNAAIATAAISKEEASAGNIYIDAKKLVLKQGAALSTEALGRGLAGNIIINASDSINISGEGSNLTQLSGISSQSIAGIAGDIILTTPILSLDNKAFINAQSNSGNGGNIRIGSIFSDSTAADTNFLFLRRGSQITTDAGGALDSSNGGNIAIKANFILAVPSEDSDISANAVKGRGGNVNINSQGLFGIQFRSQLSNSSDITASSSFGQNGNVNINTLGIDPGKNTSKLPSTPIDANRQISQTCNPSQVGEKFYVTGRGGHPANSEDYLSQEVVWLDLRSLKTSSIPSNLSIQSTKKIPQPAIGWAFNGQGKVTLVAANNESEVITNKVICPTINR